MGKNRNPTPSTHSPISVAASKVATLPRCDPTPEVKSKCERCLTGLRCGNHAKAQSTMRETLAKHGDSTLVPQVYGKVHAKLTTLIEDSAVKQKHINSAIELAQRSTELDPTSIEFMQFFASLLFDYMAKNEAYLALSECERALSVKIPVDPAEETAASTLEARINQVQGKVHVKLTALVHQVYEKHDDSTLVHQVYGKVHAKLTALIEDSAVKQKHINSAIESAQRATKLDLNSIEFMQFFASLLFDYMAKNEAYELALSECERALSVGSPVDPVEETATSTLEARINQVQGELKNQVQKCNLASSPTRLETLNEETCGPIPIRSFNEQDEYRVTKGPTAPLPRRYSIVKNSSKTLNELCKEIEVFVTATLLLQQQRADPEQSSSTTSFGLLSEEEHSSADSPASSSSPSGFSKSVSRKSVNSSSLNPIDQVRAYWTSMTAERHLSLLRASIPEMKSHYASLKDIVVLDLLSEALSFAEESGSWEFWICFKCDEKFSDAVSYLNHVSAHIGMMSDLAMEAIPEEVNPDWVGMLTNTSLKPIDVESVIRSYDEVNNKNSNFSKDRDSDNSDYAIQVNCVERELKENGDSDGIGKMEHVVNGGDGAGGRLHKWPLSDDPEREKLLKKIQSNFCLMIKHRCLSTRHVRKLLEFANKQIKAYLLPSNILDVCGDDLERTPLGLCFLDASKLQAVLTFLQELSHIGGLQRLPEKDASAGGADGATKSGVDLETVKLDIKSSTLSIEGGEVERGLRDANALFQWIYAGPSVADRLAAWARSKLEKSNHVLELVHTLERELSFCQILCDRKLEYLGTLQMLELLENMRNEKGLGYVEFLKKRYDELTERQGEELLIWSSQDEFDLIRSLIKEAYQQFKVNNSVYENDIGSRLQDMDAGDVDECRMQDFGPVEDGLINDVLSCKKDNLCAELNKLDVRIMRGVTGMHLVELKLGLASLFDYRFVLIPVIKSFVQARLEELMDKDAKDRSVAAKDVFLAELAKDDKKISLKGVSKQTIGKSKDMEKDSDCRKSKSPKGSNMDTVIHEETTEQYEVSLCDNIGVTTDEALNQDEEKTKGMAEIEANERMLQETLEFQRRFEVARKHKQILVCQRRIEEDAKKQQHDLKSLFKAGIANYQNYPQE